MLKKTIKYIVLIFAILLHASVGIFTKSAATYSFLSWQYILWISGAVVILGIYAIFWQQLIQRLDLGLAYMFKGLGGAWALLICHFMFGEEITWKNILGFCIIVTGITLFAWINNKEKGQAS